MVKPFCEIKLEVIPDGTPGAGAAIVMMPRLALLLEQIPAELQALTRTE